MKLLMELISTGYLNLLDNQKLLLLIVKVSATPEQAFETIIGNDNLIAARNTLQKLNYISINNNQITLTDEGTSALTEFNLIDESGNLTDDGQKLISVIPNAPKSQQQVS